MNRREVIAGLASTALTGFGCGRQSSQKRPVRFWAVGREGEVATELLKGFRRAYPGIDVEVQKLPWTAAHEKLLTAYAGDTLPDLCQLGNTWVPEFVALNALEPLDKLAAGSDTVDLDDYFEGFVNANRISGKLYGLPWYVDTRLLFYRSDLLRQAGFDAPPETWDQWIQMLAAIKAMVGPERYSVLLPLNEVEPLLVLALQQPDELLRNGGRWGNFRSAGFRRALEFYQSMFEHQWAPPVTNAQISNVWDEFGKGYFTFYISGPWNIGEFSRRLPLQLQNTWATAPMPGPDGPGVSTAGGASLVIFQSSKRKADVWKLVEYLSLSETQLRFHELTGNLPPRRASWLAPELTRPGPAIAFHDQMERVKSPPKVPEWEHIATEIRLAAERAVHGVSTIDDAALAVDRKTDEILEKRRWMLERRRGV